MEARQPQRRALAWCEHARRERLSLVVERRLDRVVGELPARPHALEPVLDPVETGRDALPRIADPDTVRRRGRLVCGCGAEEPRLHAVWAAALRAERVAVAARVAEAGVEHPLRVAAGLEALGVRLDDPGAQAQFRRGRTSSRRGYREECAVGADERAAIARRAVEERECGSGG